MARSDDHLYKRCRCRDGNGKDLGRDCPELRRSDGAWNPRHGTWAFRLELPKGPNGSRRPPMRRGGFETAKDAKAARDAAREKLHRGSDPSIRLTTGKYLDDWLASRRDLKRTTVRGHESNIRLYLRPLLGHIPLGELGIADVNAMIGQIEKWNGELAQGRPQWPGQRHCGPETIARIRATLRAALEYAVPKQIPYNPAAGKGVFMPPSRREKPAEWTDARVARFWADLGALMAGSPGLSRHKAWARKSLRPAKVMVWTPAQAGWFLDFVAEDRLSALFELAADAGERRAELAGLRWEDVDLDGALVRVETTRVSVGWEVVESTPKSDAGTRRIPVSQRTAGALRRLRAQQDRERRAWGDEWQDSGRVFTREDGRPVHPGDLTKRFQRLAYDAGLPPVTLHGLRHGSASYLLAAGVDVKIVSARLGHTKSGMTRDTYTTVLEEVARRAADVGSGVIPRASAGADGHPRDTQGQDHGSDGISMHPPVQVRGSDDGAGDPNRTGDLPFTRRRDDIPEAP